MGRGKSHRSLELSDGRIADVATHPATAQAWADRINIAFDHAIAAVLEVGRRLIDAKEALGHGAWQSIWTVERPVKFKLRMAQMYMRVASETIQQVAATIQALTDEETLRDFAGDDEIAADLAMAAQNFLLALDLAWKRTHAVNDVYCGVKVGREGLFGLAPAGVPVDECVSA